ncbi:MAG: SPFH domain-containing protein [Vulcanimicrobiaceae bacterium]|jgi:uncharacterized membrane protein YqiK
MQLDGLGTLLVVWVVAAVAALIMIMVLFRACWRVAEPNEALVIAGFGVGKKGTDLGFRIVAGSGTIVLPGLQVVRRLSLEMREATLQSTCVTHQGVPVSVQGVCMYKIADDSTSIANAARRFLGQKDDDIDGSIQAILDGHLRSIIGGLTVEDLIRNRDALTTETRKAAETELAAMGITVNSLQIQKIDDPQNYIENLAVPHVAEVQRAARVARAAADQAATVAEQEAAAAKAEATKNSQVRQAQYAAETSAAKAKSEQQGPLADAQAQQQVVQEITRVSELAAQRTEMELKTSVIKPAEAEAYRIRVTAEAQRDAQIAGATAAAKTTELEATARANAARLIGEGEAAAIAAKGEAEGRAVQAKVLAEAAGIDARGKAFTNNKEAIIQQTLAEQMPAIVKEAAAPFASIKDLVIFDGAEGFQRFITSALMIGGTVLPKMLKGLQNGNAQIDGDREPTKTK